MLIAHHVCNFLFRLLVVSNIALHFKSLSMHS